MGIRAVLDAVATNLYFSFTPHDDEKTVSTQPRRFVVHSRLAPPFVDYTPYTSEHGIPVVVALVESNARHPDHIPFYDSVSRCAVSSVWHLRSEKSAHEIVVMGYTLSLPSGSDTRFARFERFRHPSEDPRHRRKTSLRSPELALWFARGARLDSMMISDSKDALVQDHYKVIQTLSGIPACALDVLDVLGLADALGNTAHQYSILQYVCQWYAAAFFKLLHERLPTVAGTYKRGPAYTEAGTGRLVQTDARLVDVESAALVWPVGAATAGDILQMTKEDFPQHGLATGELQDTLRAAIDLDAALLRESPPVLSNILTAADESVARLRDRIKDFAEKAEENIERAKQARDAEAAIQHYQDASLRLQAELAKGNAEIARLKRLLESARAAASASLPQGAPIPSD